MILVDSSSRVKGNPHNLMASCSFIVSYLYNAVNNATLAALALGLASLDPVGSGQRE